VLEEAQHLQKATIKYVSQRPLRARRCTVIAFAFLSHFDPKTAWNKNKMQENLNELEKAALERVHFPKVTGFDF
jgi:hypothetical protein